MTALPSSFAAGRRFAVAPMIDWTDRDCRVFHRLLTREATLFTEMVVADAIFHGDRDRLLATDPSGGRVALQLGGSDPEKLAAATRIAGDWPYDEINLNVGCPSDRVQSGTFGACLMREPALVGECLAAMVEAARVPVTVKCRLGVDEQDPGPALDALAEAAVAGGVAGIWVHARKAWLQGLSPKENRTIPPLDYDRVRRLKARLPEVFVGLNGGLATLEDAAREGAGLDGVMLGRAAYQTPDVLRGVDRRVYGSDVQGLADDEVVAAMTAHAERRLAEGARLTALVRPMLGFFHGRPGARRWRQILSEGASRKGAGPELIAAAYRAVRPEPGSAAA